jgi:hypothetical protein
MRFGKSSDIILRSGFLGVVRDNFRKTFAEMVQTGVTALETHRRIISQFDAHWRLIKSDSTCLACLRDRPSNGLPCGHVICESCAVDFGKQSDGDRCLYRLQTCPLCKSGLGDACIRVHPPTAGIGVLSIDGGGVRGIIPLAFLKRIEDSIGLPIPLQRFFRLALGTSSGKKSFAIGKPAD